MTHPLITPIAARIAAQHELSTAGYGLVFETWQRDYDKVLQRAVRAEVPAEHQDAVLAELIATGVMSDPSEPSALDEPGTCRCGLDEMTCPSGCFDHDDGTCYDDYDDAEIYAELDPSERG